MQLNRETLGTVKEKVQKDIIPFVSVFSPKNLEVLNIINQNLPILREDTQMKELYSKYKFLMANANLKTLKKYALQPSLIRYPLNLIRGNAAGRNAVCAFTW